MNEKEPKIISFVGPAAVGKTTRAKQKINELKEKKETVIGADIYQTKRLLFFYHIFLFPFFMLANARYFRYVWSLFKQEVPLFIKLRQFFILSFIYFKFKKLVIYSKKRNISFIVSDHAFFQELTSLHCRGFLRLKKLNREKLLNDLEEIWELVLLEDDVRTIVKRRLNRNASHDNFSKKELEEKSKNSILKLKEILDEC